LTLHISSFAIYLAVLNDKSKKNESGFADKLLETIINNVQIRINNVHVRYEDSITMRDNPFVVGCTLESLIAESTDSNWNVAFLKEIHENAYKVSHGYIYLSCLSL